MYTSIMLVALSASLVEGESRTVPSLRWHSDYTSAQRLAAKKGKPVAVFFGEGEEGQSVVSREGELTPKTSKVLGTGYVCVYADLSTESGKKLAEKFDMEGPGIVLGKVGSKKPVYRHNGGLKNRDLERYLVRYQAPAGTTSRGRSSSRSSFQAAPASFAPAMRGGGGC